MIDMDGQGTQRGQRHTDYLPLAAIQGAPRNAKRHNSPEPVDFTNSCAPSP